MDIKVNYGFVLAKPKKQEEVTKSGLAIPNPKQQDVYEVLDIGTRVKVNESLPIAIGETIVARGGHKFTYDDQEYILFSYSEILAIIN